MRRRSVLAGMAGAALLPGHGEAAQDVRPVGAQGGFRTLANWTFGNARPDATVHDKAEMSQAFRYRFIYDGGKLDGLPTYWSKHRDYPEGDPRSLHVFTPQGVVLKGRIPPGGGLHPGGIESGMLRALLPVTPGMYVEMRAKLPKGLGVWPAFWLNPGVEYPDGHTTDLPWPPEIDIFEFFVWQHRTRPEIMECNTPVNGHPDLYGNPHDTFTLLHDGNYDPGIDYSADFHVFALDWRDNLPTWVMDGKEIKQTVYWWKAPPAHILITNQIGMVLPGVDLTGMQADPSNWDYTVDYLRVWRRES